MRNTLPGLSSCSTRSRVSRSTWGWVNRRKLPSRTQSYRGVSGSTISVSIPIYSGFMALNALAVSMACCSSRSGPPRPVIAVTDRAIPFWRTFRPISMISADI